MKDLKHLEDAEKKQESALWRFFGKIKSVAKAFVEPVLEIIDDLKMTAEDRMSDWKYITRQRLFLRSYLQSAGYDASVYELIGEMSDVRSSIHNYYEPIGLSNHLSFFQQAGTESLKRIEDNLIKVAPEVSFIDPVSEALENAVMNGQTLADLRRSVKEIVIHSQLPANYVYGQSKQDLWMFHRNYSTSIGTALDLAHFYYDGVAVQHSRAFCLKRKGKAFTKKEIESWADEDWQGKIPGTTKESIFWLCGSYNCIDVLRPITEQLYNRLNQTN